MKTGEEKTKKLVVVEEVVPEEIVSEEDTAVKDEVKEAPQVEEPKAKIEKTNYLWIIIPVALLVGILVGGLITYFSGVSKLDKTVISSPPPTETPIKEETPVASPSSELKKSALKIQIQNGSGVSGAASKAKIYMEGLGYKDIDTANAITSNFTKTEISIKDASKDYLDLVISDLSEKYEVDKTTKSLSKDSKYDLVITIGSK